MPAPKDPQKREKWLENLSQGHRKNPTKYWLGKKHTEEYKQKMSEACKGIPKSKEWRKKMSVSLKGKQKGDKNPNWKGGITSKNRKSRSLYEYKLWRKTVLERDDFTCQKYGITDVELNTHHINNYVDSPELRLSIDNGITLSKKAHKEFHKQYGQKNNTKEQLNEFLS